jgi:nucleotide-binding universal stress UspA family protein
VRSSVIPVFCVPEGATPAQQEITPIRTILVAVDLSDPSREVVLSAYRLLAAGGRVELCTVHELGPVAGVVDAPVNPPLDEARRARIESQLRTLVPPRAQELGVATSVSVLEGRFAAETILAAAERLDVDLVAVGSHGRSGVKRALLGSVAEQIARQSPRSVLITSVAGRP